MTPTRRLGPTDREITPIGLGCMQFAGQGIVASRFYPPVATETVNAIVRAALDGGITWFDTAEMYGQGNSERMLSSGLRAAGVSPGEVTVATKWPPLMRKASNIVRTIDTRLDALQGFPIDLYQIHMAQGSVSPLDRQVEAMASLQLDGKVKSVGVSNFSARQMERADQILRARGLRLVSNQVQVSLLHRTIEDNGILEAACRLGVTLIAYSPLKTGLLTGAFHASPERVRSTPPIRRIASGLTHRNLTRIAPLIDELTAIAHAYGATPAQIALSWLITYYGDTVVAIPGASKPRQAEESSAAMELTLTRTELDRLDEVSRAVAAKAHTKAA